MDADAVPAEGKGASRGKSGVSARRDTRRHVGGTGRGIAREHQDVYADGEKIGYTTSGTKCPYFDYPITMARIPREYKEIGTKVQIDVRGRMVDAEVIELPFYKR